MDLKSAIKKLDTQNVYGSVLALPDQCLHAWEEANKVEIPEDYKNVENIVMCGMGGSGLGARVIESLYFSKLSKPLTRVNDYHLPPYVTEKSLVFVSSYSGNTEETVQNLNEALEKKAKIIVVGAGGKLIDIARENGLPFYQIVPTYNPSNQPRMAIGYSIVGQLVLASKAGLLDIKKEEIESAVNTMKKLIDENDINEATRSDDHGIFSHLLRREQNPSEAENSSYSTSSSRSRFSAKVDKNEDNDTLKYANSIKGKVILYVSSEHLVGATHVVNNQQNENAKNLSFDFSIPELNHHLMEGLKHPGVNNENILVFFFESGLYSERVQKRYLITEEVVEKNDIKNLIYKAKSDDKLSQVFEIIQFGAFFNFYLTMLYGINPAPIPWVDYFKEKLDKG